MLILNAGQKQMNLNHQFELMYMRLFEENTFDKGEIKILRSKDGKITNRNIGEYFMSTVIIGVQSLVNIKQSFLRETKNLSSKYVKNERDTIIANFSRLFNSFTLNNTDVTTSWTFVDQYFGKAKDGGHYLDLTKPQGNIDKGVARFIYDVRCAIVHNKESEFHILYNNYEDYKDIVPLMRSINAIMAEKILETVNSQTPLIHYQSQKLDLY